MSEGHFGAQGREYVDGYLSLEFCWDAEIESGRHFLLKEFKGLRDLVWIPSSGLIAVYGYLETPV